jgi:hypothetical protein
VNSPGRVLLASLCLSATLVSAARGQTAQAAQTSSAPASQSSTQSPPGQQTPPANKKVWTNDDVGDLRDHSAISTIGGANVKPANPSGRPLPGARAKDAQWYRDQIRILQAKVPPLDDKIDQLEAALNGETVNSVRTYGGVRADDWRDQLSRLQKQRGDILAKIDALEDEARHKGVPPNKLP